MPRPYAAFADWSLDRQEPPDYRYIVIPLRLLGRKIRPLLLSMVAVLASCSTDIDLPSPRPDSFVAGYVNDPNGFPAANVQVDLLKDRKEGMPIVVQLWDVSASTCTNEKGYFSFHFYYSDFHEYQVETHQSSLSSTYLDGAAATLLPGENKYVHLLVVPVTTDDIKLSHCSSSSP
jgi:hypothetical protein